MVAPAGKCGICGVPTNQSFPFGNKAHFYCDAHREELFQKVTGKKSLELPDPKW
jgi:hypothetical protein